MTFIKLGDKLVKLQTKDVSVQVIADRIIVRKNDAEFRMYSGGEMGFVCEQLHTRFILNEIDSACKGLENGEVVIDLDFSKMYQLVKLFIGGK